MPRRLVAVVGPGEGATEAEERAAFDAGAALARAGWTVLTGGRNMGVMDAALRGARSAGGLRVGVTGGHDAAEVSPACDVAIVSGLHEARNNVIVLSAVALVVCGMSAGTASEVALALRAEKPVVLLGPDPATREFFAQLGGDRLWAVDTCDEVVARLRRLM